MRKKSNMMDGFETYIDEDGVEHILYDEQGQPLPRTPKTFDEWCDMYGEPEYLYTSDSSDTPDESLSIVHRRLEDAKVVRDYKEAFTLTVGKTKNTLSINYPLFVDIFAENNECVYCNGTFYTPNGMVTNATIRKEISQTLQSCGWVQKIDVPTNSLFNSLKDMHSVERLPVDENVIPFKNGNLHLGKTWEFVENEKLQTPYRLDVNFTDHDAGKPLFEKWLNDVFMPEDIQTIQDILGYCLVPVTAAQEAFFIVGDGGVGKSVLGIILEAIFGKAQRVMTTQELVSQRFQLFTAENKLVMYDDDLGEGALTETATLKKLITADQKIPAERKYGDPYEFQPYCKIVACANFMLNSMYDESDGFYRRLHPILVREKNPNRKTIRDFGHLIVKTETEQIVRWALKGLKRVMENGWEIHWSERSRQYMQGVKGSGTHFEEFFNEVVETGDYDMSSMELKDSYERWCKQNSVTPQTKRLIQWVVDNNMRLGVKYTTNIKRGEKHLRGYTGCRVKAVWSNTIVL